MGACNGSLILEEQAAQEREDAQLFLFFAGDIPKVDRSKPKFNCTGERLFRDRPEIYRLVVSMRAEGVSVRQVCRACHVTDDLVRSVEAREQIPIAAQKKEIGKIAARVARMSAERLEELAPKMTARDAAITFGIATDKTLVMSGDPTSRIELIGAPKENIFERMARLRDDLLKMVSGRVIEPDTGIGGGNTAQKALEAPAVTAATDSEGRSDVRSDVSTDSTQVIDGTVTDLVTELPADDRPAHTSSPAAAPAERGQGGRGSPAAPAPPGILTGNDTPNFSDKGEAQS